MAEFFHTMRMGKTFLTIQNPDTMKEKTDKFDDMKIHLQKKKRKYICEAKTHHSSEAK